MSEGTIVSETTGFEDLGLCEPVLRAVEASGYREPTEVQREAIPEILKRRDIIGGSQTGTGKTAAFALPILTYMKKHGALRCLVLEPTRELAQQVEKSFNTYGQFLDLRVTLLHGGVGYGPQRAGLKAGTDVVVATPGRLLDHLGQRTLALDKIEVLILDEADRMLDMGFMPDVRRIIRSCAKKRQNMLFSATIGPEIRRVADWVLHDPVEILIGGGKAPAETIFHAMYPVDERQKFDLLLAILKEIDYKSVIIFCRTKVGADIIARWLDAAEHSTAILHSDRTQKDREKALLGFRSGKVEILVATDIVARGIDIAGVSHVINYNIPENPGDYVHRIGRTGRMDNLGDAVTLYTASDQTFLRAIENLIGRTIERKTLDSFEYNWSPILEEKKPQSKRRNRGFHTNMVLNRGRRRR